MKTYEAKNEEEIAELNEKAASLQQQLDLEIKSNELRLEAAGLDATNAEKKREIARQQGEIKQMQLKLQNKNKELIKIIEKLSKKYGVVFEKLK